LLGDEAELRRWTLREIDPIEGDGVERVDRRKRRWRVKRLDVGLEALVGILWEGAGEYSATVVRQRMHLSYLRMMCSTDWAIAALAMLSLL
jgi:hypothetical protein